jgi:hypothetical protein
MQAELICPKHGPYDASYGTCPYCQAETTGRRPTEPRPLDEDDLPTDLGAAPGRARSYGEEEPTDLGSRHKGGRFLDMDEEPTELGKWASREDVTELDASSVVAGPLAILWVKDGPRRGKIYKIKEGDVVGRKDGAIVMDDQKVSNPHAKFTYEENQFVVWDFASRNGTFVNGERIRAATPLKENDQIKMGDTVFVLKVLD